MNFSSSLLKEYEKIKAGYPESIILFQVGIFYRLVQDDATNVAPEIGLKLITTNVLDKGVKSESIALAGFPSSGLDKYIGRLVRRGHNVAVFGKDKSSGSWSVNEVIKVIRDGKVKQSDAGDSQDIRPDNLDDSENR
jgi:DNA mismatch repair protein MutS